MRVNLSRIASALVLVALWAGSCQAAVAFDAASNSGEVTCSTTPQTFSHTVTGSNPFIRVTVTYVTGQTVSAVSYNGTALVTAGAASEFGKGVHLWKWDMANGAVPTGAHTVSVTMTGTVACIIGAASYTGVDQTTPVSGYTATTGFDVTPTINVTSAVGDLVVDGVATPGATTVDASQTQEMNVFTSTYMGGASREAGAASVTMSWTAPNNAWAIAAMNIKAAAGGTTPHNCMLLGVCP